MPTVIGDALRVTTHTAMIDGIRPVNVAMALQSKNPARDSA